MKATLMAFLAPLGPFALLLLMLVAFAETGLLAGVLLPADTLLVTVPAYLVGRRLGPRLQQGRGSRFVSPQRLEGARVFFDRHGAKAVVLSRFVPLARTLTPVLAGLGDMDRRRFLLHNVVGAVGWAAVMFGGGLLARRDPHGRQQPRANSAHDGGLLRPARRGQSGARPGGLPLGAGRSAATTWPGMTPIPQRSDRAAAIPAERSTPMHAPASVIGEQSRPGTRGGARP